MPKLLLTFCISQSVMEPKNSPYLHHYEYKLFSPHQLTKHSFIHSWNTDSPGSINIQTQLKEIKLFQTAIFMTFTVKLLPLTLQYMSKIGV